MVGLLNAGYDSRDGAGEMGWVRCGFLIPMFFVRRGSECGLVRGGGGTGGE